MKIDRAGMRCPRPVPRLAVEAAETPAGTVVEILGDCPTFEKDVRATCERRRTALLAGRGDGPRTVILTQC